MSHHIAIWQDKIILRTKEEIHPDLKPYAKYNDRVSGYLLYFGKQNLQRIFNAYGQLPVSRGQERIDELKIKLSELKTITQKVATVKSSAQLPAIAFKLPPLGEYQHRGVWFLLENKRAPLFADCGLGKNFMVLSSTEEQFRTGVLERGKVLICGKLATLETAWLDDCMKFTDLKANVVWLPAGHKRKEKLLGILDDPADIYIINHDGIMVLEEELAAKKFQKVVVDESTILKSYHGDYTRSGGKFGKALMNISKDATWRVVMSGTPAPNGPEDLWGQFKFLDPEGFLLEPSFYDFRAEYMDEICYGRNPVTSFKKYIFRRDMTPHIKASVDTLAYQVKIRDHLLDLPPKTVIARRIRMSEEQHKHYAEMLMNLATMINDEFVSIDVRLAQIAKLRQITGGFLIDQEEVPHGIETATKLEALDCLMEELGDNKIVIYAQYRWEIKTIAERYKDLGLVTVYGNNKSEDNLENIKSFIQNEKIKVIVLHPKSAAHGVTFTVSHYMIFYSSSYSAEDDYQCVKRIERAGQKHPIFIYYLVSTLQQPIGKHKESIDEIMYRVIQIKSKNQSELIDQGEIYKEMFSALA